jgi:imidazoleglycerol-phosphate dehydratase/histidinol-phosphatase
MSVKRVLFIDRDGTIIEEPQEDKQVDSLEKLMFVPGAISALHTIARDLDFELVMVTNQDGLGTEAFPEEHFWPAHNKMLKILEGEGVVFSDILIDRSVPSENKPTRKPGTAMLHKYLEGGYDLKQSYVIGDRITDVELARNMGTQAIQFSEHGAPEAVLSTTDWKKIVQYLKMPPRKATVERKTRETEIQISLNLDGTGETRIRTGLGFFDHMLEQIGRHGHIDLHVDVAGDLHVDEHHTVEDTALVLGQAFLQALAQKKGINRYGFLLPMDDALAQVAIDFGGRPWFVWNVEFRRERIGDVPTELFAHFFKSFTDTAQCNLNIRAEGTNEHHKIESIFKAFAKAVRMAVQRNADALDHLPSTKGLL